MSRNSELWQSSEISEIIELDDTVVCDQNSNPDIICLDDSANQSQSNIPSESITTFHRLRAKVDLTNELTKIRDYSDEFVVIPVDTAQGKRKSDDEFDTVRKVRKIDRNQGSAVCNETVTIEDDSCLDCDIILSPAAGNNFCNTNTTSQSGNKKLSEIIATCSKIDEIDLSNGAKTAETSLPSSSVELLNPAVRFSPYNSLLKGCAATHELLLSGMVDITVDSESKKVDSKSKEVDSENKEVDCTSKKTKKKKKKKDKKEKSKTEENNLNDSDCIVIESDSQNSSSKIVSDSKRTLTNSNSMGISSNSNSNTFSKPLYKNVSSTFTKQPDSTFHSEQSSCFNSGNLLEQDKIPLHSIVGNGSVQNDEDIVIVIDDAKLQKEKSDASKIGKNVSIPTENISWKGLRPVIIDGSNVAFSHGLSSSGEKKFSSKGIEICINYFKERGHKVITFVPLFRKSNPYTLQPEILVKLAEQGHITFTPSRRVNSKLSVPYDDRYIVQCAVAMGGVIVSSDNYRDLLEENEAWRSTIENRLLMFTFIGDMLMFPQDPLGRSGPNLEEFLRFPDE